MSSSSLNDPKWQKRRLEILNRDNFTCQDCGATDKPLHVHHKRYVSGREYWQYQDWELTTLCEDCHGKKHLYVRLIPVGQKTPLDIERDGLIARLTNQNYREILPRVIEIDRMQYVSGYSGRIESCPGENE